MTATPHVSIWEMMKTKEHRTERVGVSYWGLDRGNTRDQCSFWMSHTRFLPARVRWRSSQAWCGTHMSLRSQALEAKGSHRGAMKASCLWTSLEAV